MRSTKLSSPHLSKAIGQSSPWTDSSYIPLQQKVARTYLTTKAEDERKKYALLGSLDERADATLVR